MNNCLAESRFLQAVRIWDVLAIGPAMIYFGIIGVRAPDILRLFMVASGIGAIILNGINYIRIEKKGSNNLE